MRNNFSYSLISLLFNCCSNIVYANDLGDNQNESVGKIYTYVNQGNIRVDGYEDENGNKIFRQYEKWHFDAKRYSL